MRFISNDAEMVDSMVARIYLQNPVYRAFPGIKTLL